VRHTFIRIIFTVTFALSLAFQAAAQQCPSRAFPGAMKPNASCQPQPNCNTMVRPNLAMRPTRTAEGVPIRYVDVPIPNYANCGGNGYYNTYGYGYGSGGYGYGYGSGGYTNYNGGSINASAQPQQRVAPRRETTESAPPDPRSARNYQLRKALDRYARQNSVGGRIYLADESKKWLLSYTGAPVFSEDSATIPCLGKVSGGQDQPVLLTLRFDGQDVVDTAVIPQQR
jgi:hypothetical protein